MSGFPLTLRWRTYAEPCEQDAGFGPVLDRARILLGCTLSLTAFDAAEASVEALAKEPELNELKSEAGPSAFGIPVKIEKRTRENAGTMYGFGECRVAVCGTVDAANRFSDLLEFAKFAAATRAEIEPEAEPPGAQNEWWRESRNGVGSRRWKPGLRTKVRRGWSGVSEVAGMLLAPSERSRLSEWAAKTDLRTYYALVRAERGFPISEGARGWRLPKAVFKKIAGL